ncbi:MAG: hypothetical protein EBT07_08365 [Actinobacteria bacterium]|nr:hypothetical protein [Actinomycetota bacterium]
MVEIEMNFITGLFGKKPNAPSVPSSPNIAPSATAPRIPNTVPSSASPAVGGRRKASRKANRKNSRKNSRKNTRRSRK